MYRKASFGACAQSRRTTMIKTNHYIESDFTDQYPGEKDETRRVQSDQPGLRG